MIVSVRVRKVRSTKTHGAIHLEATYFRIVVVLALPLAISILTSTKALGSQKSTSVLSNSICYHYLFHHALHTSKSK